MYYGVFAGCWNLYGLSGKFCRCSATGGATVKRLYNVNLELNMPVLADSPEEARQMAYDNYRDEVGKGDFHAHEATKNHHYDNTWYSDSHPYGDDGRTLQEIWDSMNA